MVKICPRFLGALALLSLSSAVGHAQTLASGYQPVGPSDLVCIFNDINYLGEIDGGAVKPVGGHIGKFSCGVLHAKPKPLELSSDKFEEGFVKTKDFGDIQVFFENNVSTSRYLIAMKPDQKENILKFIRQ